VLVATATVAGCCFGVSSAAAGVIDTIYIGDSPYAVSSDGTHVWVTNLGEGSVSEIEASSGTVIRTIPVGASAFDVSSDGTDVWVTSPSAELVTEIDASSGTVVKTIPVGSRPHGISSDGAHVWLTNPEEDTVTELDAASAMVLRTIPVGSEPEGVSADGTHVWVANYAQAPEGTVSEIEASSGTVIRTISAGRGANGVSSDGAQVWVTSDGENTVREIEASTGSVIHTINVGREPYGVSADGTHVWVANYGGRTLSEILPNPPGPGCNKNTAIVKLSPGLTSKPAVQRMTIKGNLTGCQGEPFTAVSYKATLMTPGPVECAALTGAGEPASGAVKYEWTPKTKPTKATGTLSMPLTRASTVTGESFEITTGPAFEFSGEVTAGPYSPLAFTGTATTRYIGGARCGQKHQKPVREGELSKSEVSFF
jgi:YVTN family beta-propeller protein